MRTRLDSVLIDSAALGAMTGLRSMSAAALLARELSLDAEGRDESIYLAPIAELVSQGRCPAEALLAEIPPPGAEGFLEALLDAREF